MKRRRVILTGFMGTGKTAVGEALAKKLKFQFLDTDLMIEEMTGKTITEIFEKEGEASFRVYEKKMVRKALEQEDVVIATGGGAVIDPENLQWMKEKGLIIALASSPEAILERVAQMQTRPLMNTKDQLKRIKELLSERSPYYRKADKIVDTTSRKIEDTVDEITKILKLSAP